MTRPERLTSIRAKGKLSGNRYNILIQPFQLAYTKPERIVLERSARLNLDPGKGDQGDNNNNNNNNNYDEDDDNNKEEKEKEEEEKEKEKKILAGRHTDRPTKGSTRGPRGP